MKTALTKSLSVSLRLQRTFNLLACICLSGTRSAACKPTDSMTVAVACGKAAANAASMCKGGAPPGKRLAKHPGRLLGFEAKKSAAIPPADLTTTHRRRRSPPQLAIPAGCLLNRTGKMMRQLCIKAELAADHNCCFDDKQSQKEDNETPSSTAHRAAKLTQARAKAERLQGR